MMDIPDARTSLIQTEQLRLIIASSPGSIAGNIALAALLALAQKDDIDTGVILGWLTLIAAIAAARMGLYFWHYRSAKTNADSKVWLKRFRLSVAIAGAGWGVAGWLLFPAGVLLHQTFLAFVLAGLSAAASATYAIDVVCIFSFLLLALAPFVLRLFIEGGEFSTIMGLGVMVFTGFLLMNMRNIYQRMRENIVLRIEAGEREQELQQSEVRLNRAQHSAHVGNWELDLADNRLHWSDEIYRIFEIDQATFGASYEAFLNAVHPDDRERVNKTYMDSLANHEPYDIVHRLRLDDGRIKYVHEHCETHFDAEGKAILSQGTVQDITERELAGMALKESESRFRFMLENSPIAALITTTAECQVVFANQRYADLINSAHEKVTGVNPKQYYANPQDYADVLEQLSKGKWVSNKLVEMVIPNEHSTTKWALASYLPLEYHNESAVLGWFYDITDRKTLEEQAQHLAYHDPLTGLPNRLLFSDRVKQALALAKRDKVLLALMFIDLDKFKPINDTFGHEVGDLILKEVAQRIQGCLRESDTVGRIGGDEFVVLLPTIKAEQGALEVAEKIRHSLNQSFELAGQNLSISSSTGIAIYPEHGNEERQLIKNADAAMYFAKSAGRDNVQIYRSSMQ